MAVGFPGDSVVKNPPGNVEKARDADSNPESGRSPGIGHGNPLQYSSRNTLWTEEPGGIQSTGLQRVGHSWAHTHNAYGWWFVRWVNVGSQGYLSFSWPNIYIVWIRTIFWRTVIIWDTVRQSISIKFTKKIFITQNVMMRQFWKFYRNKLAFITYTGLEQTPREAKCEW